MKNCNSPGTFLAYGQRLLWIFQVSFSRNESDLSLKYRINLFVGEECGGRETLSGFTSCFRIVWMEILHGDGIGEGGGG